VAASPKKTNKRRIDGSGRVTPKGGPTKATGAAKSDGATGSAKSVAPSSRTTPAASTRYTPPADRHYEMPSPVWVPIIMFTMFGLGMLVIFLNYVAILLPGATSNWYLLLGLGFILGGIITATQYR